MLNLDFKEMAANLHNLGITCSPARDIFEVPFLAFRPYGSSTATNVLEHFLGTPEVITNVNTIFNILFVFEVFFFNEFFMYSRSCFWGLET